jgi:hypothetical protein
VFVNDTAVTQQISHQMSALIHKAMVVVQQQQINLLMEKYRSLDWNHPQRKADFIRAAAAEIAKGLEQSSSDLLMKRIEKILKAVFVADFFRLNAFQSLMAQLEQMRSAFESDQAPDHPSEPVAHADDTALTNGRQASEPKAIAILLLDAENIKLSIEEEQFLQSSCNYSIQIKIAFANWRTMGKYDADFHRRGYQLIHVPPGKNSADMKMTAIGSSIFIHYPNAKAIFVCSSDQDLAHLKNALQAHGLTVYSVRQRSNMLVVRNSATGKTETYTPEAIREVPTIAQAVVWLKEIIQTEHQATGCPWVKLSRLNSLFSADHGTALGDVMRLQAGRRIKDIFLDHPRVFVVHQSAQRGETYVCLFAAPPTDNTPDDRAAIPPVVPDTSVLESAPFEVITSEEHLEEALLSILEDLLAQSNKSAISIAELHTYFQRQYGQTMRQVLQSLHSNQRYITFLGSCRAFKLTTTEKGWLIGISEY